MLYVASNQPTGLQGIGTRMRLCIVWIKGTVLWTVSAQPSTPHDSSRRILRSSKLANCQRWCTVFNSPIWTNQAPTPSITSRRAVNPRRQCVSHSNKFPGCSVYDRSSNSPPRRRGGVVGQNENSCMREVFLLLIKLLSLRSNSRNSGCCDMLCREA